MRRGRWICAAALLLCVALLSADAGAASRGSDAAARLARDCTTESRLSPESPSVVRYVVWCGVQPGRVTLRIGRPKAPAMLGFSDVAQASGPGAGGPLRCRARPGGWAFCSGRKSGPVTYRGTVTVGPRTRCVARLKLDVPRWTGDSFDLPGGCPESHEERPRRLKEVIRRRADRGLDLDLAGDRAAIVHRAKGLLAAWMRGDPVARWTSLEEAFGMPLRAAEQAELEYRDRYRERFQDLVEEGDWVEKNAPDTYAGYQIDSAAGGIIYVGFTAEPEAMLERLRSRLIAPGRFLPFPVTPTHTEEELFEIQDEFMEETKFGWGLVNSLEIDYLANKIEVGTQHVARVRRLIAARYEPDAPFKVVFERPGVLL